MTLYETFSYVNHTITILVHRLPISQGFSIDIVTFLIDRGTVMVEYFGLEIDNPKDYVEEDMKRHNEKISFFEFYLDGNSY